ncbi:hypothetical protein BLA29_012120 [Euroglyphus maynei]|uniref:Uncharacterized protein n=1 Tax=Euroglyphus maynei TaxID=6958 RepID=A0A1Y3BLN4_EURMA|nr:hypothetical protein BLA29_012120 [Euroglyphus maynei]
MNGYVGGGQPQAPMGGYGAPPPPPMYGGNPMGYGGNGMYGTTSNVGIEKTITVGTDQNLANGYGNQYGASQRSGYTLPVIEAKGSGANAMPSMTMSTASSNTQPMVPMLPPMPVPMIPPHMMMPPPMAMFMPPPFPPQNGQFFPFGQYMPPMNFPQQQQQQQQSKN